MNKVEKFLKSVIEDPSKCGEFEFYYVDGHTSFHGRTTISIKFSEYIKKELPPGNPPETIDENEKTQIKKNPLSEETAKKFIQGLISEKIWELKNCKKFGEPDETQPVFQIKKNNSVIWEITIWHNCINQDKRAKAIYTLMTATLPK